MNLCIQTLRIPRVKCNLPAVTQLLAGISCLKTDRNNERAFLDCKLGAGGYIWCCTRPAQGSIWRCPAPTIHHPGLPGIAAYPCAGFSWCWRQRKSVFLLMFFLLVLCYIWYSNPHVMSRPSTPLNVACRSILFCPHYNKYKYMIECDGDI